jgi:hypothetical protein
LAEGGQRPAIASAERVDFSPLLLDDEEGLVAALSGCEVLFNTYWVRFEHGGATFAEAIERSGRLFHAASGVGVRRIVHLSVSNASADSPFPYFRGKAAVEDALRGARAHQHASRQKGGTHAERLTPSTTTDKEQHSDSLGLTSPPS